MFQKIFIKRVDFLGRVRYHHFPGLVLSLREKDV